MEPFRGGGAGGLQGPEGTDPPRKHTSLPGSRAGPSLLRV